MKKILNTKGIDRIYDGLINGGECADLPETQEERKKLKAYFMANYFSEDEEEAFEQWLDIEQHFGTFGMVNERQGFVYGFNYAAGLFRTETEQYNTGKLDDIIRNEYSTMVVSNIDKTDSFTDAIKKYVPMEEYFNLLDVFCVCLDETKYSTFEQGFLRGIAAERGGVSYGR